MLPVHHKAQPQRKGNTVYLLLLVLLSVGLVVEFGYWRKQLARLVVINEQLRSNAAELRAQNDKLSSSVADQKDALHSVMKQNSELDGEKRAIQEASQRHEEQLKSANEQLTQSSAKVKELQGRVGELTGEKDACEARSTENLKELAGITSQLEKCSNELTAEVAKAAINQKPKPTPAPAVKPTPKATSIPSAAISKTDTALDSRTKSADVTFVANPDSQQVEDSSAEVQGYTEVVANEGGSVDPTDLVAPDENKSQSKDEEEDGENGVVSEGTVSRSNANFNKSRSEDEEEEDDEEGEGEDGVVSKGTVSRSKANFNPGDESNDSQEEIRTVEEARRN
ncbi:hypothetical protein BSKO_00690 [Bryopsis sp. KO-2023]|nr:hypothetical protein BSKO_00690 [Bryopsis sp. KO-2023]